MRMSQAEKELSHARIVASAAKLLRERGIDGASVADVMHDAGMSHGGFYKHFDAKESLLAAALDAAFDEIVERLRPAATSADPAAVVAQFCSFYLSERHLRAPAKGCPIAAAGTDFARGTDALRQRFGAGVRRITDLLARGTAGAESRRRARALRQLAMMAGAMMIARASDPQTAHDVLSACREKRA